MQYAISFTGDRHYRGGWTKDAIWQGPFPTRGEAEACRPVARDVGAGDEVVLERPTPRAKWRPAPGQTYRDTVDCTTGLDDCPDCDGQGLRTHKVEVVVPPAEAPEPDEECDHPILDKSCCAGCGAFVTPELEDFATTDGTELVEEYRANDAQTRRGLAAGDDSAIRDDSAEEEAFPVNAAADHAAQTRAELDRLLARTKADAGYREAVDGMTLGHRLFDYRPDSWTDPGQFTAAHLRRGEIVRLPRKGGDCVITSVRTHGDEVLLSVWSLTGTGVAALRMPAASKDFRLRLDLLYLDDEKEPANGVILETESAHGPARVPRYRGVLVPGELWPNLHHPEFHWWKSGVDSALNGGE